MWIKDHQALPAGTKVGGGRPGAPFAPRTTGVSPGVQAGSWTARTQHSLRPVRFHVASAAICSYIHLTRADYHVLDNVLNKHSLMVFRSNVGVSRSGTGRARQLLRKLLSPHRDPSRGTSAHVQYAGIWRQFRGLSRSEREGLCEPLPYCTEELKSPGPILPKAL